MKLSIIGFFLVLAACAIEPHSHQKTPLEPPLSTAKQELADTPEAIVKHVPAIGDVLPNPFQTKPVPKTSLVVVKLLKKYQVDYNQGNYQRATATLERALRIEPGNSKIWHHLAEVKFAEKDFSQAVNMASKSNSLARGNDVLRDKNNTIITQARMQLQSKK